MCFKKCSEHIESISWKHLKTACARSHWILWIFCQGTGKGWSTLRELWTQCQLQLGRRKSNSAPSIAAPWTWPNDAKCVQVSKYLGVKFTISLHKVRWHDLHSLHSLLYTFKVLWFVQFSWIQDIVSLFSKKDVVRKLWVPTDKTIEDMMIPNMTIYTTW